MVESAPQTAKLEKPTKKKPHFGELMRDDWPTLLVLVMMQRHISAVRIRRLDLLKAGRGSAVAVQVLPDDTLLLTLTGPARSVVEDDDPHLLPPRI